MSSTESIKDKQKLNAAPNCDQCSDQGSKPKLDHYDVIVVGGGLIGSITAIALAKLNLSIALIEAKPPVNVESEHNISSFDQRSVALSASSVAILQSLHIWQSLQSLANPIDQILVSDQNNFGFTRLNAADFNFSFLGQVIPLSSTGPKLWQLLQQENNIQCYSPAVVEKVMTSESACQIVFTQQTSSQQQILQGRLLIGADGSYSKIADALKMSKRQKAYGQSAIIANVETECEHDNRAFERFTTNGPLALLPLKKQLLDDKHDSNRFAAKPIKQNLMSLVWCHEPEKAEAIGKLENEEFCRQLQQNFGYRLGKIKRASQRIVYPLSLHQTNQSLAHNVLLIGNAARTLHPIAGQGFNLGLRDIAELVELLENQLKYEKQLNVASIVQEFLSQRQPDWSQTIGATDSLVRVFSTDFFAIKLVRNKAMGLLNKLPFLKQKLSLSAMGYSGRSSRLARGIALEKSIELNGFGLRENRHLGDGLSLGEGLGSDENKDKSINELKS